mmetsp:Transcript_103724/g.293833  ORF Transcript_103724/g.293833 Transcript_103724/m.293833 type:complete len:279 (+) Transcript_103724:1178-2014(+)
MPRAGLLFHPRPPGAPHAPPHLPIRRPAPGCHLRRGPRAPGLGDAGAGDPGPVASARVRGHRVRQVHDGSMHCPRGRQRGAADPTPRGGRGAPRHSRDAAPLHPPLRQRRRREGAVPRDSDRAAPGEASGGAPLVPECSRTPSGAGGCRGMHEAGEGVRHLRIQGLRGSGCVRPGRHAQRRQQPWRPGLARRRHRGPRQVRPEARGEEGSRTHDPGLPEAAAAVAGPVEALPIAPHRRADGPVKGRARDPELLLIRSPPVVPGCISLSSGRNCGGSRR